MAHELTSIELELRQTRPLSSRWEQGLLSLLRTASVAKRPTAKLVEPHGISTAQYNVLRILRGAGDDGMPTLSIRERLVEEAAGITRLIDKLVAAGLVRRERRSADRRQVLCWITPAGLEVLARLQDGIQKSHREVMGALTDDELQRLMALLEKVRANCAQSSGV
jgi:DNA-binding MarR family transcriptional regulator